MLCRVRPRQPAEVSGVPDEVGRGLHGHAALRVLVTGAAAQPTELQSEGLRSKVVPYRLERGKTGNISLLFYCLSVLFSKSQLIFLSADLPFLLPLVFCLVCPASIVSTCHSLRLLA